MLEAKSSSPQLGIALLLFSNNTSRVVNITSNNATVTGYSHSMLRQPTVHVNGNVAFDESYTYAELSSSLGVFGGSTSFQGDVSFSVSYGDTYTLTRDFTFDGQASYEQHEYTYDELAVLYQSLPILIVVCIAFVSCYICAQLLFKKTRIAKPEGFEL
jgi:hypothetical protein